MPQPPAPLAAASSAPAAPEFPALPLPWGWSRFGGGSQGFLGPPTPPFFSSLLPLAVAQRIFFRLELLQAWVKTNQSVSTKPNPTSLCPLPRNPPPPLSPLILFPQLIHQLQRKQTTNKDPNNPLSAHNTNQTPPTPLLTSATSACNRESSSWGGGQCREMHSDTPSPSPRPPFQPHVPPAPTSFLLLCSLQTPLSFSLPPRILPPTASSSHPLPHPKPPP